MLDWDEGVVALDLAVHADGRWAAVLLGLALFAWRGVKRPS